MITSYDNEIGYFTIPLANLSMDSKGFEELSSNLGAFTTIEINQESDTDTEFFADYSLIGLENGVEDMLQAKIEIESIYEYVKEFYKDAA